MTNNSSSTQNQPPPAQGVRLDWTMIPSRLRAMIEDWLQSPVASVVSQNMGFSPGVAARITTADNRQVFVKAIGPQPNMSLPTNPRD